MNLVNKKYKRKVLNIIIFFCGINELDVARTLAVHYFKF